MNAAKRFAWLLTGVTLALAAVTCAPTTPPSTPAPAPTPPVVEKAAPVEQLTIVPAVKPPSVRERVEMALDQVRQRDMRTDNGFWTIFHGILGLGPSVTLRDPLTGTRVNAVDYVCAGNDVRGLRFMPTKDGIDVLSAEQFVGQGHQDQFIAEMAQWGMPADRKFVVAGKDYTFEDFLNHARMRARVTSNQELSWTVIVVGQYYGTEAAWTNRAGEKLTMEDLLRYELEQAVETSACGGTHRLFGLDWVQHLHVRRGGKVTGVWQAIADHAVKYQRFAKQYQNADGSFSTDFFRGPGNAPDKQLRMNTTGHTLEWLALSLSDAQLREPWVEEAVNALAMMFLDTQSASMEGGTLYHAAHGLLLYYARVWGPDKLGKNAPLVPLPDGGLLGTLPPLAAKPPAAKQITSKLGGGR